MLKSVFFSALLTLSAASMANGIKFIADGNVVQHIKDKKLKSGVVKTKKGIVGSVDKTIFNVFRGYERTYRGYSFREMMTAVYGKKWKKARSITFRSLDGYKQTVRVKKLLKASEENHGYLAFKETGKSGFTKFYKNPKKKGKKKKVVNPGPYYLVWDGYDRDDKGNHADHLKWPYQLASIAIKTK